MVANPLWQQLLPASALLAIPVKYAFDRFDGVRIEKHGAKGLAFVCWYGLQRRPPRLPRWVKFVASKVAACLPQRGDRAGQHATSTKKAVAFIFNSGRVPLKTDDLFQSKPLKLALIGDGQFVDVKLRYESDQTAGIRLTGERKFLRKPKHYLTERALEFAYLAPGHGLVLDIEYIAEEPVTFSLSGPVSGMKGSIQQKTLFEIDIENDRNRARQRRTDKWRLLIGSFVIAAAAIRMGFDIAHGDHAAINRDWTYWTALCVIMSGEWLALAAWFRMKQVRKVPAALRFFEPPPNSPSVRMTDRTSA
jgi:hypothetical protein